MALQSIRLLLWLLALWRNAALEQSYTEPCRVLRMFLFSLPKTLRVLYDGIFTSNLCARFLAIRKNLSPRLQDKQIVKQRILFAHVPHIWEYFWGVGEKGNLKPMDLDGETCGICALFWRACLGGQDMVYAWQIYCIDPHGHVVPLKFDRSKNDIPRWP